MKYNLSHLPKSYVNVSFLAVRILAHKLQKLALVKVKITYLKTFRTHRIDGGWKNKIGKWVRTKEFWRTGWQVPQ